MLCYVISRDVNLVLCDVISRDVNLVLCYVISRDVNLVLCDVNLGEILIKIGRENLSLSVRKSSYDCCH